MPVTETEYFMLTHDESHNIIDVKFPLMKFPMG